MSDVHGRELVDYGWPVELGAAVDFTVVAQILVDNGPITGMAVSPDGSRLIVTNYGGHSLSIIDTRTGAVLGTVAGVHEPFALAMGSARADRAYVSTVAPAFDSIVAVDLGTNTVRASYPVALSVTDLVVSRDGKQVYLSRTGVDCADVAVLDPATGDLDVIDIATAPGTTTGCVRLSPAGRRLYVAVDGPVGGQLVVIGTSSGQAVHSGLRVIDTIDIGWPIRDVAISPDGSKAYVVSCAPDSSAVLDIIDTRRNKIVSTCKLGEVAGVPTQMTISGDGKRAYLVSEGSVMVLCTATQDVLGAVRVGGQPSCALESPDGKHLYVADYRGGIAVASIAKAAASRCA